MIPDGVRFHQGEDYPVAMLKWRDRAWVWVPAKYGERPRRAFGCVALLVSAFQGGFDVLR